MGRSTRLIVNRPSVIFDVQGAETVIINLVSGHYFRLNRASTPLWLRFADSTSISEMLESCENSDALSVVIDADVESLLERELLREASDDEDPPSLNDSWRFEGFELEEFTDLEDILGLDPIHEVDPARGWPHLENE